MINAQCKEEGICVGLRLLREPPMDGGSTNAHNEGGRGIKKNATLQINTTDILKYKKVIN